MQFWGYLKKELGKNCNLRQEIITAEEKKQILALRNEKYMTKEWNFRHLQQFDYSNKRKWDGGILEARVAVQKEKITQVVFYGDFLSRTPLDELEQALTGKTFLPQEVRHTLSQYPLEDYFGSITMEEVLDTMFIVS